MHIHRLVWFQYLYTVHMNKPIPLGQTCVDKFLITLFHISIFSLCSWHNCYLLFTSSLLFGFFGNLFYYSFAFLTCTAFFGGGVEL